jgi:hypothetical protein
LRGWPAAALVGEEATWASLDIRWGFDLWRAVRAPILKKWGLQTITHFDYGRTVALAGPQEPFGAQGWRANVGVGVGKLLGIPGYNGNVRLYVSHPVLQDHELGGWRVLLAFEN